MLLRWLPPYWLVPNARDLIWKSTINNQHKNWRDFWGSTEYMYNLQSTTGNLLLPWSIRSSYSMLPCLHGRRWDLLWEDEAAATQGEIHGLMRGPSYQNGLQWCFWGSLSERSAQADASNSKGTVEYSWTGTWQAALVPLFGQDKKVRWCVMCIKLTSCVSSHRFDN